MPTGDKPFEVGDRVIVFPGRLGRFDNAKEGKVEKVYKTGKFTVDATGKEQYRNPYGTGVSGDVWSRNRVDHWTPEQAAKISHAKLVGRVAVKIAKLSRRSDVEELSTDQLCRIEALLDKITEERAKEQADG